MGSGLAALIHGVIVTIMFPSLRPNASSDGKVCPRLLEVNKDEEHGKITRKLSGEKEIEGTNAPYRTIDSQSWGNARQQG